MTLEIVWSGEADVYDIPRPDTSALAEFEILSHGLATEKRGAENVLRHEFVMQPLKEGEYDMGRIRVQYYEKDRDVPMPIPLPQTPVTVLPREIVPRGVIIGIVIGLLFAAGGLAAFFATERRKRLRRDGADTATAASDQRRKELATELNDALALRMDGEIGAYMEKLCEFAGSPELEPHVTKLDDLRGLAENVKFGGLAPSPDQLNWAEKLIKNAIREAFPVDEEVDED